MKSLKYLILKMNILCHKLNVNYMFDRFFTISIVKPLNQILQLVYIILYTTKGLLNTLFQRSAVT